MNRRLEAYLSEVASHLGALPPKRRADELSEMRAHLENAVIVNRELGRSEDEAAQNAVAQFGTASDLASNLIWAWRRGERRQKRGFWGAVVSVPATVTGLMLLMSHLPNSGSTWLDQPCAEHRSVCAALCMALVQGLFLAEFGLAGAVAGALSPRRAVLAACLGLAGFWIGWAAVDGLGYGGIWPFLLSGYRVGWDVAAVLAAWAAGRWRGRSERRARV